MVVAIVGYAKSGKTAFCESLVEAAVGRGIRVAAIKVGRAGGHVPTGDTRPDSVRLADAGADPVVFWSEGGIDTIRDGIPEAHDARGPLPDRVGFATRWLGLLPAPLRDAIGTADLVVIEGRPVADAAVVQMVRMADGAMKYPRERGQIVITKPDAFGGEIDGILRNVAVEMEARHRR